MKQIQKKKKRILQSITALYYLLKCNEYFLMLFPLNNQLSILNHVYPYDVDKPHILYYLKIN